MADVTAVADQIREIAPSEFADSNDAHETLINAHEIIAATQETMHNLGELLAEQPGITPEYAEAAHEASASLSGIADALQEKIGQGIVRS